MRAWNLEFEGTAAGRLQVNVPVSIRTRDDRAISAANRIGFAFVTVPAQGTDDDHALLVDVKTETERIKDWKLAHYFLGGLAFGRRIPGLLRWALRRRRSFATAVFSYVGRFDPDPARPRRGARWVCGDLTLERVTGVPPVRPLTRAAVVAIEYAGRISICLRTDPFSFDASDRRALLDTLVSQTRRSIEGS
jgi:hypothetical protein